MQVNKKKPLKFKNPTNYFKPDSTKVRVTVGSPESYSSRKQKIEGYETRLYWQFRYCEDLGGQTFYYTLTYNDKAMPKHYGVSCFDYEDLRDFLTGGFRKQLLRNYGTSFKYFIGAELGDGKGERGMHNNPHYHILFFLEPSPFQIEKYQYVDVQDGFYQRSSKKHKRGEIRYKKERQKVVIDVPYKRISPEDFRHFVRLYWQGFDEDIDGFHPYNDAKFGIAHEGLNVGLVTDFRACMYCAKYVCKDAQLKQNEEFVLRSSRWKHFQLAKRDDNTYKDFLHSVLFPMFNTPLDSKKSKWSFNDVQLIEELCPGSFKIQKGLFSDWFNMVHIVYEPYIKKVISHHHLWNHFNQFVNQRIDNLVDKDLNEWRNRYCNKCRISQGVGESALQSIQDKLNPSVQVPCKEGFKNRPLGLYLYRKLYCDVVKDSKSGCSLYVLNQLGQDYKLSQLPKKIEKLSEKAFNNLNTVLHNSDFFVRICESDVNTQVTFSFNEFSRMVSRLSLNVSLEEICKRYAEYKLVYEDRFFEIQFSGDSSVSDFPPIDVLGDYKGFLVPSFYSVSRNDLMLDLFLEDTPSNYMPYSAHSYFLRYISVFNLLDLCSDYFFIQKDNKEQKEAEEIAAVKRFHDKGKLKEFYSKFR